MISDFVKCVCYIIICKINNKNVLIGNYNARHGYDYYSKLKQTCI